MKKFRVTGMSCAACAARVERSVKGVPGVRACSVSLLTNSMLLEGNFADSDVILAVKKAGYGASPLNAKTSAERTEDLLNDRTSSALLKRFVLSVVVLCALLYFSMAHPMLAAPVPAFLEENARANGLVQMLLAAIVLTLNRKFFVSGFRSLFRGGPNMDTLVAMGSGASFLYSVAVLIFSPTEGFYFETSAMIVTLITLGKFLESVSKGRTTDALRGLMKLSPKTATVLRNGAETVVDASEVKVGDIFLVKPGESIPVDGIVLEGSSAVDESALSGESIPVDKTKDSVVSAATLNRNGFLKCRALRVGKDTTLERVIRMVSEASASKAPIAKIADRVAGVFVPLVMGLSVVTFFVWFFLGKDFAFALSHAIALLVVSCPCALGLATPVAIMVGTGKGARNGILFKTGASLEETGRIQIVALDKTGTITQGKPVVTDIFPQKMSDVELLSLAASVEKRSEHPISKAILEKARERSANILDPESFVAKSGLGIEAVLSGKKIFAGNLEFIREKILVEGSVLNDLERLADEGKTPVLFASENSLLGIIAVADALKEDSARAILEMQKMGICTVMLSGDNRRTAEAIAKKAHIGEVLAGILPGEKAKEIRRLQKRGKVAMVGDGINDAPALAQANVGMAIGAGTDVALDAADVVLVNSSLEDVCAAIRLSRATLWNIRENLFWAFFYNVALMPLAAGAYYSLNGWSMHPVLGAFAMSLSSFCVVTNALRLNLKKIRGPKSSFPAKIVLTLSVEGMMCAHCEARVQKALLTLPEVECATANHKKNRVRVECSSRPSEKALREAIEKAGYRFRG